MEETEDARVLSSASPGAPTDWHSIDWKLVMTFVGKAQLRIAQAEMSRDHRRVKRLQRSLARSWQAKALAVRKVTSNQGKRTSGIDRELWSSPQAKWDAVGRLNKPGYRAKPLRRIYIPKSDGTERPLGIPVMLDRAMQALFLLGLEPVVECRSDTNSYGFRRERSTHDAQEQLFRCLSKEASALWVLDADIQGFFDHINHDWLTRNVPMNKRILKQWLKSGVIDRGHLHRTELGTPQGGVISPTLANLTLNGLEPGLEQHLKTQLKFRGFQKSKVNVVRYADDFVITGASPELLDQVVRPWVEQFLRERGLSLSQTKTRLVHIRDGFDFLGWNFRKYGTKLLIKPSLKNVKAFYGKVSEIIRSSLSTPTAQLVRRLNPILQGWANYHKGVVAKATFSHLDHLLYWRLMRWGQRRHPRKSKKWIWERYWPKHDTRHVFTGVERDKDRRIVHRSLLSMAGVDIVRHIKVKGAYNPFDPKWFIESEILRKRRMSKDIWDNLRLKLWTTQSGLCALCKQPMDSADDLHDHHIVYRQHGGTNALSNRVLLHPICHRRVHALGLEVTKPVPARGL